MSGRAALFAILAALGVAGAGCGTTARLPIPNVRVEGQWRNFTPYVSRMTAKVHRQWQRLLTEGRIHAPAGGYVAVTFVLDPSGRVSRIVSVDEHSTELAMRACVGAITDAAPFGPWTAEMKDALGNEGELTFTFHFE